MACRNNQKDTALFLMAKGANIDIAENKVLNCVILIILFNYLCFRFSFSSHDFYFVVGRKDASGCLYVRGNAICTSEYLCNYPCIYETLLRLEHFSYLLVNSIERCLMCLAFASLILQFQLLCM